MDSDSICHNCARRNCPDVYTLHKFSEYKGLQVAVTRCPLYLDRDENKPMEDEKNEWA